MSTNPLSFNDCRQALERTVDDGALVGCRGAGSDDVVRSFYEVDACIAALRAGGFKRAALQFPDWMLGEAPVVALQLQASLPCRVALHHTALYVLPPSLSSASILTPHPHRAPPLRMR